MALYYNFQNDRGASIITNMAAANATDPSYAPAAVNGHIVDWNSGYKTATAPNLAALWANDGRFRGKPALTFNGGNTPSMIFCDTDPLSTGKLANLLQKTQAITIVAWTYIPPGASNAGLLWWGSRNAASNTGQRVFAIDMPWGGTINWTVGDSNGAITSCSAPLVTGNDSKWVLWAFTWDARAGIIKNYMNGQLIASKNVPYKIQNLSSQLPIVLNVYPAVNNLCIGDYTGASDWTGVIDELAIFDADISPNDVPGTGQPGPNRFQQMYDMGVP